MDIHQQLGRYSGSGDFGGKFQALGNLDVDKTPAVRGFLEEAPCLQGCRLWSGGGRRQEGAPRRGQPEQRCRDGTDLPRREV